MVGRSLLCLALCLFSATALPAQSLRDRLLNLFQFGVCETDALLCLTNTSGQDAALAFSDALESGNNLLIGFVTNAIGLSVASIPTPATSSGSVVEFTPGGRVETRLLSGGPIYAERAPSLGKGKLLVGVLFTQLGFEKLRGVPIQNLLFNFRHVDIPGTPGLGNPNQENNILQVRMELAVRRSRRRSSRPTGSRTRWTSASPCRWCGPPSAGAARRRSCPSARAPCTASAARPRIPRCASSASRRDRPSGLGTSATSP